MSNHSGSCRQLIHAFQEMVPSKGDSIFRDPHVPGTSDECFRKVISSLVNQAALEPQLSVEYAIICQQIAEIFEPIPGLLPDKDNTVNQFKYILANQLQQNFISFRKNHNICKNHEEHVKLQEDINFEEDFVTRTRLRKELEARMKSRQRATGTVKLIAELFNVDLINGRVINLCMRDLLCGPESPSELDIECFHILMTSTGEKLESHPVGVKTIEKYLSRLDAIIDEDPLKFGMRTRFLMLEIFQFRGNGWKSPAKLDEPEPQPGPQKPAGKAVVPLKPKMLDEVKATRFLFQEINDVLHHLGPEEVNSFVKQFRAIKFQSENQLEGAVKIVFERIMAAPNMLSLFALVCKGLAGVSAPSAESKETTVTFELLLVSLIQQEVEVQQENSRTLREGSNKIKTLRSERSAKKAEELKDEIENDFKLEARFHRFTVFISQLFNVDMLESRFIFEYANRLLARDTISSSSVASFYFLIQSADGKLFRDKYNIGLLKSSLSDLSEAMKTIQFSHRTQFMVKDLLDKCRVQLKILSDAGLMKEFSGYSQCDIPWSSTLSEDPLWPKTMDQVEKLGNIPPKQTNGHFEDGFVTPPRDNLIHRRPSPVKFSERLGNPRESLSKQQQLINFLNSSQPSFAASNHELNKSQQQDKKSERKTTKKGNKKMKKASSCNNLATINSSNCKGRINPAAIKNNQKRST